MLESRFIRLTDYCVVEFQFSNVDSPILTSADIVFVQNEHMNIHQIFNDNNSTTNNIQDNTAVPIGENKFMYIDEEKIPDYIDADSKLHKTELGELIFAYDKVRVHFVTGFAFTEYEALIFGVKNQENDGKYNLFTSILLTESIADGILTFNPKPLFLTDVIYDRYIDVIIPSIKKINKDYYNDAFVQADQLGAKITTDLDNSYNGFSDNSPIILTMDEATSKKTIYIDSIPYDQYTVENHSEVSLEQYNEFDSLGGHISESEDGDYIEVYATYNGGFPGELMSYLNSKNPHDDWIIIHQLSLFEQIGSSFLNTNKMMFYQEDSYDEPYLIRPVLKYAHNALSFSYDYIIRLVNQRDGTQIIRSASFSSTNPKKYGKNIVPIQLVTNIVPHRVYNKLIKKSFESDLMYIPDETLNPPISKSIPVGTSTVTKIFLPMFVSNANVTVSDININVNNTDDSETLIYGQNELHVILNPFDNVFRFYFFEKKDDQMSPFNLNVSDNYKLVFMNGSEEVSVNRTIYTTTDVIVDTTHNIKGELIFVFPSESAKKILNSDNRNFYITTSTAENVETVFYHGVWNPVEESNYVKQLKQQKKDDALVLEETIETENDTGSTIDPAVLNQSIEIAGDISAGA